MGWWRAGKDGTSMHAEETGLVWGDGPADIMDDAIDKIVEEFREAYGRKPSRDELEAGLKFSLGANDEQETPGPNGRLRMATWSRSEKTRKTVSYTVPPPWPQGATWPEVQAALEAAKGEVRRLNSCKPLSDDALWVKAEDDRIVIYFEMPGNPVP